MPNCAIIGSTVDTSCGATSPTVLNAGSPNVFVEGVACAFVGSGIVPHARPKQSPHGGSVSSGSPNVFVNGKAVARVNDPVSCGAKVVSGAKTVSIN